MKHLIIVFMICLLSACGGGTSGTASTGGFGERTFVGTLTDQNGAPLSFAKIEIQSTGDTTTADANGAFSLLATVPAGANEVIVTAQDGTLYLITTIVAEDEKTVLIDAVFSQQASSKYKKWQISARIIGSGCESSYFSVLDNSTEPDEFGRTPQDLRNNHIEAFGYDFSQFLEITEVTPGTTCTVSIEILKNGKAVPNLSYQAKVRTCTLSASQEPILNETSLSQGVSGINGEILVPFTVAASDVCGYEILIPDYADLKLGFVLSVATKFGIEFGRAYL